jgi:hypothetical protein
MHVVARLLMVRGLGVGFKALLLWHTEVTKINTLVEPGNEHLDCAGLPTEACSVGPTPVLPLPCMVAAIIIILLLCLLNLLRRPCKVAAIILLLCLLNLYCCFLLLRFPALGRVFMLGSP